MGTFVRVVSSCFSAWIVEVEGRVIVWGCLAWVTVSVSEDILVGMAAEGGAGEFAKGTVLYSKRDGGEDDTQKKRKENKAEL